MSQTARTRFAPSPTGYLHIGGARTALFNYLLARRLGGKFILRIEDTDQTRNIEHADRKLLEDLRWLGQQWDEGPEVGGPAAPYHQSQRLERYRAAARQLLERGQAYYALETREELDALRSAAMARKQSYRYPRPQRFPTEAEAEKARAEGRPVVVRFKMPGHDFEIQDEILGPVRVGAEEIEDFVIVKSDGWPTYHFAVVVDDEEMLVTHVMRGQEHLINTPKHMALQQALGYRTPSYAHLPLIFNMNGSKMSKREKDRTVRSAAEEAVAMSRATDADLLGWSGATPEVLAAWRSEEKQLESAGLRRLARHLHVTLPEIDVHDFRISGYLPQVVVNFIALLGWSPGDGRERFTLDELAGSFGVERIGKTNARFDREKLLSFNTTALAACPTPRKLAAFRDYLTCDERGPLADLDDATLARLLEMNSNMRTFRDVEEKCAAIFTPDEQLAYDADAVQKNLVKGGAGLAVLRDLLPVFAGLAEWSVAAIEAQVRGYGESRGLGLGKVAQPLRVAATGTTVSPPIFETLQILGQQKTLARMRRAIACVEKLVGEGH